MYFDCGQQRRSCAGAHACCDGCFSFKRAHRLFDAHVCCCSESMLRIGGSGAHVRAQPTKCARSAARRGSAALYAMCFQLCFLSSFFPLLFSLYHSLSHSYTQAHSHTRSLCIWSPFDLNINTSFPHSVFWLRGGSKGGVDLGSYSARPKVAHC